MRRVCPAYAVAELFLVPERTPCWEHTVSSRGSLWCLWKRSCTGTGDPTLGAPRCRQVCQGQGTVLAPGRARAGLCSAGWPKRQAVTLAALLTPSFVPSPHTCWSPQPRLLPPPMHIQHSVSLPPMSSLSPLLCIHLLKLLPYVVFHLGFCHLCPVFHTLSSQLAVTHAPGWPFILPFTFGSFVPVRTPWHFVC